MTVKLRVGSPWSDELHAMRDSILHERALAAQGQRNYPSISQWYDGRSVMITGASGFIGRVILELLLRTCPGIQRVYVILRPKKGVPAQDRLPALLDVPLFDRLRSEQPTALSKVVPLSGDIASLSLGISDDDRRRLCNDVSVIFHVAASVRFDEPFQKAVFTNLRSTREIINIAKEMPQLKALVHVSTAYCHLNQDPIGECVYPDELDWREVIRWAEELPQNDLTAMGALGKKLLRHQANTYVYTKALAEQCVQDHASELPVIITRPSIVISSLTDPIPGWTDNFNGIAGFFIIGSTGVCKIVQIPNVHFDTIPVDLASKIIVIASWAKGLGIPMSPNPQEVDVVNVAVGASVGICLSDLRWVSLSEEINKAVAFPEVIRGPNFNFTMCPVKYWAMFLYYHFLFAIIVDLISRATGKKPRIMSIMRKIEGANQLLQPFKTTVPYRFALDNQHKLLKMLLPEDKNLDVMEMYEVKNNEETFMSPVVSTLKGQIKYLLNADPEDERNYKRLQMARRIEKIYNTTMALIGMALLFGLYHLLIRSRTTVGIVNTVKI